MKSAWPNNNTNLCNNVQGPENGNIHLQTLTWPTSWCQFTFWAWSIWYQRNLPYWNHYFLQSTFEEKYDRTEPNLPNTEAFVCYYSVWFSSVGSRNTKPNLYHIFGHIHHCHGVQSNGTTTFINAAICDDKGNPKNQPIVFDLKKISK